jgi:hypothetical protein
MVLKRHNAKVTCILYPHSEHTRYDPNMLVTGSLDFSVILWNINTGEMIHRFVVQTGEILQLSVPPNNVNVNFIFNFKLIERKIKCFIILFKLSLEFCNAFVQ